MQQIQVPNPLCTNSCKVAPISC